MSAGHYGPQQDDQHTHCSCRVIWSKTHVACEQALPHTLGVLDVLQGARRLAEACREAPAPVCSPVSHRLPTRTGCPRGCLRALQSIRWAQGSGPRTLSNPLSVMQPPHRVRAARDLQTVLRRYGVQIASVVIVKELRRRSLTWLSLATSCDCTISRALRDRSRSWSSEAGLRGRVLSGDSPQGPSRSDLPEPCQLGLCPFSKSSLPLIGDPSLETSTVSGRIP